MRCTGSRQARGSSTLSQPNSGKVSASSSLTLCCALRHVVGIDHALQLSHSIPIPKPHSVHPSPCWKHHTLQMCCPEEPSGVHEVKPPMHILHNSHSPTQLMSLLLDTGMHFP